MTGRALLFFLGCFALDSIASDRNQKSPEEKMMNLAKAGKGNVETEQLCRRLFKAITKQDSNRIQKQLKIFSQKKWTLANCRDKNGYTAMHYFAKTRSMETTGATVIFILLRYHGNAQLGIKTNEGMTPLMLAVTANNLNAVHLLIAHNQSNNSSAINEQNSSGLTALHIAIHTSNVTLVEKLLQANADPLITDINGQNAFDYAKQVDHAGILKALGQN